ncbi:hypothetical protein [Helicobacter pylori]|uniref:hypothetical protein n=1 Tax=Helicobacter pylori TaxID=210 RepID=UPI00025AC551|nr:hypothetical protein [Helicobacter pylori]EIE29650.1 Hypothetical protein HP17_08489 [Helicobacter pylori NCTC 11637 = CCUG 17874 = ATCC 43504 = JCM 12093]MBM0603266.1 hypothetical protein [Helicobacter pylori]MBM0610617.1 hypothetical protein [Helicobacter pylori]MBM0619792.1 hypothetical protein [Helicobacter pylori]MBM0627089.1 hypothetical protein [Helicobacter pylori]
MGKMKQETAIDYEKLANHWNNNDENSEALNAFADAYLYKHEKKSQKVRTIEISSLNKACMGEFYHKNPNLF